MRIRFRSCLILLFLASIMAFSASSIGDLNESLLSANAPSRSTYKIPARLRGLPSADISSVQVAIERYGIRIPPEVADIQIDDKLIDRGQTRWANKQIEIIIGPAAFTSWGLLASTLGHEAEIHANQNIEMIRFAEAMGFPALRWAESKAYKYEISNAKRFGLTEQEVEAIEEILQGL